MALFKILKGSSKTGLDKLPFHEGYAYLVEETHKLYVDISDTARICLNAEEADVLVSADGTLELTAEQINEAIGNITRKQTAHTLTVANWVTSGDKYQQVITIPTLTGGPDHTISPIISYTDNQAEYSKIESATADFTTHTITFIIPEVPTGDIPILVQDR